MENGNISDNNLQFNLQTFLWLGAMHMICIIPNRFRLLVGSAVMPCTALITHSVAIILNVVLGYNVKYNNRGTCNAQNNQNVYDNLWYCGKVVVNWATFCSYYMHMMEFELLNITFSFITTFPVYYPHGMCPWLKHQKLAWFIDLFSPSLFICSHWVKVTFWNRVQDLLFCKHQAHWGFCISVFAPSLLKCILGCNSKLRLEWISLWFVNWTCMFLFLGCNQ